MSEIALKKIVASGREFTNSNAATLALFTATLFTSAILVFSVQPVFAKMILPTLGGSPSVWAVSMCFFQAVLLAGYAYAHMLDRWAPANIAPFLHLIVLAAALFTLPFGLPSDLAPPAGEAYFWLIGVLLVGVGLPFFAVSASAPLLQSWFARTGHPHATDPYFLYGASNLGSLLALLSYPVAIEPFFGIENQAQIWTHGFMLLALCIALCATLLCFKQQTVEQDRNSRATQSKVTWTRRAIWIGLAFVPSGLLVSYTSHVTTDIASAPFLWVIPLATFLATFVLVFRDKPLIPHEALLLAQPFLIALVLFELAIPGLIPMGIAVPIGFLAFFVCIMVAHRELFEKRPASDRLTEFYMWMSLGGVLGGIFSAIIAPQVFSRIFEFPLLLVLALLCRPGFEQLSRMRLQALDTIRITAGVLTVIAALILALRAELIVDSIAKLSLAYIAFGTMALLLFAKGQPLKQLGLIASLGIGIISLPSALSQGHTERSFYGVHRILLSSDQNIRILAHGTTTHGAQRIRAEDGTSLAWPTPATYYHNDAPMAQGVFATRQVNGKLGEQLSFGVVGVGTGALACYAKPDEKWRFYEIDPLVIKIATNPKLFNYFSACQPNPDFVVGDARLTLAKEPAGKFDYLVIDAFSSDSIPVHLLTREAIQMYLEKTSQNGILAMHISNRHMDLASVASATIATIPGVHAVLANHRFEIKSLDRTPSQVIFISRSKAALAPLLKKDYSKPAPKSSAAPWTDDYSDVISAIWRGYAKH